MTRRPGDESEKALQLIGAGADMLGAAAGTAAGLIIGGPAGAVAGSAGGVAIGHTFRFMAAEVKRRLLGQREEARVGATYGFALAKIEANFAAGRALRSDDFFRDCTDARSAAAEVLEAVLLAGQREPEERKLRYYGNLYGNIPFDPEVSRQQANLLIRLGSQLSYTQLCLLQILSDKEEHGILVNDFFQRRERTRAHHLLVLELYNLYSLGLVDASFGYGSSISSEVRGVTSVAPGAVFLQTGGERLREMMELASIPRDELEEVATVLR